MKRMGQLGQRPTGSLLARKCSLVSVDSNFVHTAMIRVAISMSGNLRRIDSLCFISIFVPYVSILPFDLENI